MKWHSYWLFLIYLYTNDNHCSSFFLYFSGYELANRDLEIRGAGAIIGKQQSGVADRVGPDVYLALLKEAIESERSTNIQSVPQCHLLIQAADIILRRGLPEEFLDAEERKSATESALAEKSPREITAIGKISNSYKKRIIVYNKKVIKPLNYSGYLHKF